MKGGFTLPGEAGYEALTLSLAKRWDADMIRDSDGTALSDEILGAGYGIYSTICLVREHNAWISDHPDARQQTFLCSRSHVAFADELVIDPMEGFFDQQFAVNDGPDALPYWQVYDRTTGELLSGDAWAYDARPGTVRIHATPYHRYTVSFLAFRVWEEISMYNHVTNGWSKEHLMQLNPYHDGARAYLCEWLEAWCADHPQTTVVRFTSLFYNFAWIWGSDARNRSLFTDWASYDFTVCPAALKDFERQYGYALTAEDFVRGGRYCATHTPPSRQKRDWMAFIGAFVRRMGRACVDIVHRAGKKAFVFYDDSWVGLEPSNGHFGEFGFDGIIKCVFSGFEVRLCASVPAQTHELRFHPYLFPTGLGGGPTFSHGGDPAADALRYWVRVRRALLRVPVERVGLGGYLHLVEPFPSFVGEMDRILGEFRAIGSLHQSGPPLPLGPRIGIVTTWGALRTWTLSGHFHETDRHVLIHVLESLSGLPTDVRFLSFDDLRDGVPEGIDVLVNAGEAGSAWSGADAWQDAGLVAAITGWVADGGVFIGVDAPSAAEGGDTFLRMAHVLGVDIDRGEWSCHGKWPVCEEPVKGLIPAGVTLPVRPGVFLKGDGARVLLARDGQAMAVLHAFGRGKGVYLSGFETGALTTRLLLNLLLHATERSLAAEGVCEDPHMEAAVFPVAGKAIIINNDGMSRETQVTLNGKRRTVRLPPYGMDMLSL